MEDTETKVRQIISALFNIDESTLNRSSSPETIEEWDSMGQLMLIIELEQQFDTQITPEVGEKMISIGSIADALAGSA